MFTSLRARILVILAVAGVCGFNLYRTQTEIGSIVKLGLDLRGGMHLVLEVDDPDGLMSVDERSDAIDRAERIIRNRVDELGVEEPLIQKVGQDRLIVELAGVDEERAKDVIGQTALLEWKLVLQNSRAQPYLDRIDQVIVARLGVDSLRALGRAVEAESDAQGESVSDLLFGGGADSVAAAADSTAPEPAPDSVAEPDDGLLALSEEEQNLRPFSSLLFAGPDQGEFLVPEESFELARGFLQMPEVQAVFPRTLALQWGWEPYALGGAVYRQLFVLERDAFLTGNELVDAQALRDPQFNQAMVTFELNRVGGRRFGEMTGQHVNERIAIMLDGEVVSAPIVRARIGSRGQIELGGSTLEEARDLALVLRAGALPAALQIIEERTVGPSLGQDSIDQGRIAGIVGIVLVILIMALYYRVAGVLAVGALGIYVVLVLGGLAAVNANLTLPGIAGLILSVGMAVDANVLIFERIREELAADRSVRTAVDEGFAHALSAIVDSNITTLLTALVLLQVGTGPVRGFAVTLTIGIIASFFTALYVTRTLIGIYLGGKRVRETLSI